MNNIGNELKHMIGLQYCFELQIILQFFCKPYSFHLPQFLFCEASPGKNNSTEPLPEMRSLTNW